MSRGMVQRVHRVTFFLTLVAVVFCLFFQINKRGPLGDINPFGVDPYDAVGSFAIQIAFLVGVLTYARALRLWDDPSSQAAKVRLILRGNVLVLSAILITLVCDAIAVILTPPLPSFWGNVLLAELAAMFALALVCVVALALGFRGVPVIAPPRDLTPADGIDDLWALVRVPVTRLGVLLPPALVVWVQRANSDWLFARLPWVNPRTHPWRFVCALGLLVGVGLLLVQLQEGLPPSLMIGLLVAIIFIGGEFAGAMAGFALLGGYLGLRPPFRRSATP